MIGILTFQFAHNYGAVLQAYALKKTLYKYSDKVEIINYLPKNLTDEYSNSAWYCIRNRKLKRLLRIPRRLNQVRKFSEFQKSMLELKEPLNNITESSFKQYDVVVVGSDQVWNDEIVDDIAPYFFENICGCVKMSYAASFGIHNISDNIKNKIKMNLPKFDFVSVREKNGKRIIQDIVPDCKVEHVCDPVFLIDREVWRKTYRTKEYRIPKGKYILYVDLRNNVEMMKKASILAKQEHLEVYSIHPTCWKIRNEDSRQLYNVGPLEYLNLIDHAEIIVTNSFHAVAFSAIFGKRVLHQKCGSLGDRVEDLYNTLSVASDTEIIDFDNQNYAQAILDYRKKSIDVLDRAFLS